MKTKATLKAIKEHRETVIGASYHAIKTLFCFKAPTHYASGTNGWVCDYYVIDSDIGLVTGVSASKACTFMASDELCKKYEDQAKEVFAKRDLIALINLADDFINEAVETKGKGRDVE